MYAILCVVHTRRTRLALGLLRQHGWGERGGALPHALSRDVQQIGFKLSFILTRTTFKDLRI